jgi:hypothetical protein
VAIQGFGVSGTWTFMLAHTTMMVVGGLAAVYLLAPHLLDDSRTRTAVQILVELILIFSKTTPTPQELGFYLWMSILWFVAIWLTVADAARYNQYNQGVTIFCIVSRPTHLKQLCQINHFQVLNIIMTAIFVFETFLKFIDWRKSQGEHALPPGVVHSQHSTV